MRTVEIIGYKRANLGKADAKRLRADSQVPCVLYGGKEQVHFYSPMILFREIVYTPNAAFVKLNIEGEEYSAILQDIQFHPVSEVILHADFMALSDDKLIKMNIPVKFTGEAPGIIQGGILVVKLRKIRISALPENMPESITL
ncbi:MAG: 50S ribosomal protein L25, partial [Cyclobacteriaceae bacterium]|nr:50S ribosomal protein L25 [Cyclobacteriaceae bacterium]